MSVAQESASEAARMLARSRWGAQKVTRAAQTVIERAAELDPVTLAEVHEATAGDPARDGDANG
jgi:hypothetical protein